MRIAILGAGVSGLTAGRLLHDQGNEVVLYEKNSTAGGLARSRFVNGYLFDPHGGHIFNSKHTEVVDWVFSILPKDKWQYTERNAKIFYKGRYISYPFELSLCELDESEAVDCIYDFLLSQNGPEPGNFRDWLYWNFGRSIADSYMIPYNQKIWAYPLEQMETQWVRGKMPLPTKKEMIRSMLLKDPKERKMPHSSFYYPLDGGIQTMVDSISRGLNSKFGLNV
ncbi:MAG: NAD(P)-binding protein [Clostridium sp.]|nr:NAD(P)-binding protein [Clostridium sp.]